MGGSRQAVSRIQKKKCPTHDKQSIHARMWVIFVLPFLSMLTILNLDTSFLSFFFFLFFLPSHVHSEKIDLLKDKRREYFSSAEAIDVRCM